MRNHRGVELVVSVDRALQLALLLRAEEHVTVKAAADHLDVAPSTAYRLLATLAARGFATQDEERRYRAGPVLRPHRVGPISLDMLREAAAPALRDLHAGIGDTVQLMVLTGTSIQFIDGIESTSALRVAVRRGDRMPAYCSAGGKAMLAALPWIDVEDRHRDGLPPWPSARLHTLAQLKRELARTRANGFGQNIDETERGVSGIGTTIVDPMGAPVAAFTVAIPTARFQRDDLPRMAGLLTSAADRASARLAELTA